MRLKMATSLSTNATAERIPGWISPTVLVTLFLGLALWSWGRWADPIIDFGNEPYVSWQLLHGRALYRDLAWLYGPLSPWLNALWFTLFGASLTTLAVCNLVIAACLAIVVYRFCARCADRLAATTATAVLLVSFVFAHHAEDAANYNFVWPYTYAATHGTVLLVCGVAVVSWSIVTDRPSAWASGGLLLGATMLTKAEIGMAAAVVGIMATLYRTIDGRLPRFRGPALLVACGVVPGALCWLFLGTAALLAPWAVVARVVGGEHGFNAHLIGTDDFGGNVSRLGVDAGLWSVVTVALVVADLYSAGMASARRRWLTIAAVAIVGALVVRDLPGVGRPLPVLIPIAAAGLIWVVRRRPADRDHLVPLVLWAAAAWVLLARMFLNVHFHHYGFYLAMPAAVFVVVVGVGTLPRLLAVQVAGGGRLVRSVALATVGLLAVYSVALSTMSYSHMTVTVGHGNDSMLGPDPDASPTGTLAVALAQRIVAQVPPGATLAVLPDGTLMNFITRRPNSTPFSAVMPPVIVAYGLDRVLGAYEAHPPQYIVLFEWPGDEYGVGTFGTPRWGAEIVAWVARRYERIDSVPSSGTAVGFSVWRERTRDRVRRVSNEGGQAEAAPSSTPATEPQK